MPSNINQVVDRGGRWDAFEDLVVRGLARRTMRRRASDSRTRRCNLRSEDEDENDSSSSFLAWLRADICIGALAFLPASRLPFAYTLTDLADHFNLRTTGLSA